MTIMELNLPTGAPVVCVWNKTFLKLIIPGQFLGGGVWWGKETKVGMKPWNLWLLRARAGSKASKQASALRTSSPLFYSLAPPLQVSINHMGISS